MNHYRSTQIYISTKINKSPLIWVRKCLRKQYFLRVVFTGGESNHCIHCFDFKHFSDKIIKQSILLLVKFRCVGSKLQDASKVQSGPWYFIHLPTLTVGDRPLVREPFGLVNGVQDNELFCWIICLGINLSCYINYYITTYII